VEVPRSCEQPLLTSTLVRGTLQSFPDEPGDVQSDELNNEAFGDPIFISSDDLPHESNHEVPDQTIYISGDGSVPKRKRALPEMMIPPRGSLIRTCKKSRVMTFLMIWPTISTMR
jgi:hypothetical protein